MIHDCSFLEDFKAHQRRLISSTSLSPQSSDVLDGVSLRKSRRFRREGIALTPLIAGLLAACSGDTEFISIGVPAAVAPAKIDVLVVGGTVANANVAGDGVAANAFTNPDGLVNIREGVDVTVNFRGAINTQTGTPIAGGSITGVAAARGDSTVAVVSPLTALYDLAATSGTGGEAAALNTLTTQLFGANSGIVRDDVHNPDFYELVPGATAVATPATLVGLSGKQDRISKASLALQEAFAAPNATVQSVYAAILAGTAGYYTGVSATLLTSAGDISTGTPFAIPALGLSVAEDAADAISIPASAWGFRDPGTPGSVNPTSVTFGIITGGTLSLAPSSADGTDGTADLSNMMVNFADLARVRFTPDSNRDTPATIAYTVTDAESKTGSATLGVNIVGSNDSPTGATLSAGLIVASTLDADGDVNVGSLIATDPDTDDTHTFALATDTSALANEHFEIVSGAGGSATLRYTGGLSNLGDAGSTLMVAVTVTDAAGETADAMLSILVGGVFVAPGGDASVVADRQFSGQISIAENSNGSSTPIALGALGTAAGPATITLAAAAETNANALFSVTGSTLNFIGATSGDFEADVSHVLALTVDPGTLGGDDSYTENYTLSLTNVDESPSVSSPAPTLDSVSTGNDFMRDVKSFFTSTGRDTTYTATGLRAGVTIDAATGVISGNVPTLTDASGTSMDSVVITATDTGSSESSMASFTLTYNNNQGPTAMGTTTADLSSAATFVGPDGSPLTGVTFTVVDSDDGEIMSVTAASSLTGTYGTFTFAYSGTTATWGYTLDNASAAFLALPSGEMVTDTLNIATTDDAGGTNMFPLVVSVRGQNDTPVVTLAGTVASGLAAASADAGIDTGFDVSTADTDTGDTHTYAIVATGATTQGGALADAINARFSVDGDGNIMVSGGDRIYGQVTLSITATDSSGVNPTALGADNSPVSAAVTTATLDFGAPPLINAANYDLQPVAPTAGKDTIDLSAMGADGRGFIIHGSSEADTIMGSMGDDIIIGGYGNDKINLTSGGADIVVYRINSNSQDGIQALDGADIVSGFTPGEDRIIFIDDADPDVPLPPHKLSLAPLSELSSSASATSDERAISFIRVQAAEAGSIPAGVVVTPGNGDKGSVPLGIDGVSGEFGTLDIRGVSFEFNETGTSDGTSSGVDPGASYQILFDMPTNSALFDLDPENPVLTDRVYFADASSGQFSNLATGVLLDQPAILNVLANIVDLDAEGAFVPVYLFTDSAFDGMFTESFPDFDIL